MILFEIRILFLLFLETYQSGQTGPTEGFKMMGRINLHIEKSGLRESRFVKALKFRLNVSSNVLMLQTLIGSDTEYGRNSAKKIISQLSSGPKYIRPRKTSRFARFKNFHQNFKKKSRNKK